DPATELPRQRRPAGQAPVTPGDADAAAAYALAAAPGAPATEDADGAGGAVTTASDRVAGATNGAPTADGSASAGAQGSLDLGLPVDDVGATDGEAAAESYPDPGADPGRRSRLHLAPAHPDLLRQAIVAAVAESHRGPGLARSVERDAHPALRPNPWNGRIRDPEILRQLRETFDESYRWSASKLESYARVPFLFLLQRVLRVDPKEEADEETSPLAFGSVAHEILERFYSE